MWLLYTLVLLTLVAYVDAVNNVTPQCPKACTCGMKYSVTQTYMHIDCGQGFPNTDKEQLAHQLESMLSADQFIERPTSLSNTNTPVTRVPQSVCQLVNLTSLNLDNNNITALPDNCFVNPAKLVTLSANRNSITGLQDELFSKSLDLTSLRSLNLYSNRLTSLEPWWYYRCILGDEKSPVAMGLYNNWISNFTNKQNFHFRCDMKRPCGYLDLSWNRITHFMDISNGWNIGHESLYIALLCLRNLKGAHPRMRFHFAGHYACDYTDFPFYKARDTLLAGVRCTEHGFYSDVGRRVSVATVPLDQFVCELSDRCPSSGRYDYRPANATLQAYISINLSSVILHSISKSCDRCVLDLSDNKRRRRRQARPYFVNTSIFSAVNLRRNVLESFPIKFSLLDLRHFRNISSQIRFTGCRSESDKKLILGVSNYSLAEINTKVLKDVFWVKIVNLGRNTLASFPRRPVTVNISAWLLIGDYPCDNSWMIGWLQSLSRQILDPGDITCVSPSRMYGRNVLKSTKKDFCVDPVKQALIITLSVVASVADTVIIIGTLLYKLRIQFYRRWKFHPFDRDECVGEDLDYDVFLSCSSMDDDPHGLHILELMEAKGYQVCYHERDFLPGQRVTESIVRGVERSKRTVCLISEKLPEKVTLIWIPIGYLKFVANNLWKYQYCEIRKSVFFDC